MNSDQKVQLVWDRFVHRVSSYALQRFIDKEGKYQFRPAKYGDAYRILNKRDILDHLIGKKTIGLYTTNDDQTCKWLCIDVDEMNHELVRNLVSRVEERYGANSCLVEFSGSRGYHIWLFFAKPEPAASVVQLGRFLIKDHKLEIYPRQAEIDGVGNLVKLPLGLQKKTGNRCWFVDEQFEPYADQWSVLAQVNLITYLGYFPPEPKPVVPVKQIGGLPCFTNMMEQGFEEGTRDIGIFKLGCYLRDLSLPFDVALSVAYTVNTKSSSPFTDDMVEEKIQSAYSRDYSKFPCQEFVLDHFCSPTCKFFASKAKTRKMSVEELTKQVG